MITLLKFSLIFRDSNAKVIDKSVLTLSIISF